MEMVWSNKIDEIFKAGISLHNLGIRNWAFSKEQSFLVLEQLLEAQIAVLGGDVATKSNNVIELNYDNWFCNQLLGEAKSDFVIRSINKAKIYIENYPTAMPNQIYFLFVPSLE
ncbi:MAG: hypothetical protein HQL17_05755 [Candidatus Omnitrophica bacterium]|nr:hypothetical protein [Candidatus Omnitrophota bacterium]